MKTATLHEVKSGLGRFVAEAGDGPVVIMRNGKPCAALVTLAGMDLEAFALAHSPRFLARLDHAARQARTRGTRFSVVEAQVEARIQRRRKAARRRRTA